ncbi:hypothetical protein EIP91_007008 [Steccherinum ochraceum]|uniref:DUF1479 domain protein n=1 Tax=Steccherinum ochraceum TaxID=92696 RepID=A0A4R0RPF5_9APHY|nr:hypothetical protein EIP91_007008 [Steccherinum ochraceum]
MLLLRPARILRQTTLRVPLGILGPSRPLSTATSTPGQVKTDGFDGSLALGRAPKKAGTIEDVFSASLDDVPPLPARFLDLKKELFRGDLVRAWTEVLEELKVVTDEVASRGQEMIPRVEYSDIQHGLTERQIAEIKRTGSVIVKGGVPKEDALAWKQSVRDYAAANAEHVKGSPADKIVFYELYYSKPQISARSHPALINTQRTLLSLWHTSDPTTPVSLSTPISYFDRLRIRPPGPSVFTLGPHIDSGGLERWEDPGFRGCFKEILNGDWRNHDAFDASRRIGIKQDLYNTSGQCSVFRPWQGWTSLSATGPREGTLRLLPFLSLSTAYIMLRPFFRPKLFSRSGQVSLAAEDWEVDLDSTAFPGSEMGKAQGLSDTTHPHLRLNTSMMSIPRVEPGDQVYWHCDLVHAVEAEHTGAADSSVFYIPTIPLTAYNFSYLRDQAARFQDGTPPHDFPGGEGEAAFVGRATPEEVKSIEARRLMGLEPFDIPSNATAGGTRLIKEANSQFKQQNNK